MAKKGQKFRSHSDHFKLHVVMLRLQKNYSIGQISRIYKISDENVVKWTHRFLNGEPLTMKRGRPGKLNEKSANPQVSQPTIEEQLDRLKAELAYKDKVIEYLEERERLKKKSNSDSSKS